MNTRIATGTPQDVNEDVPAPHDPWPSRTLGAYAPAARPAPVADDVPAEADYAPSPLPGQADPAPLQEAFPEGPNVAPSPWEEEAARGRS